MSIFGTLFRVTTFGESHGIAVGCVCDGVPAGLPFAELDVQPYLDRRRPGQNSLTTKRRECDTVEILSGVENGITLGTPVAMIVRNADMRSGDYLSTNNVPRPGHADFTYQAKYGLRASSGGGRSSARETVGRVCAGALAMKYMQREFNISIVAFVDSVMEIALPSEELEALYLNPISSAEVDRRGTVFCLPKEGNHTVDSVDGEEPIVTRCPHGPTAVHIADRIASIRDKADSCGGTVVCVISNVPIGLGEPVFDKFQAKLAQAMLSIPAVKGIEFGRGFGAAKEMTGVAHNDAFGSVAGGGVKPTTNNAGGLLGGVSSGENIYFRVAFKPVSSIGIPQETVDFDGNSTTLALEGRHDPCVLPRAPPIVEAMAALTTIDFLLLKR